MTRLPIYREYAAALHPVGNVAAIGDLSQLLYDAAVRKHQAGDLDEAGQLLVELLSANPAHGEGWYFLAIVAEQSPDLPLARMVAERAARLLPDDQRVAALLSRLPDCAADHVFHMLRNAAEGRRRYHFATVAAALATKDLDPVWQQ